MNHRRYYVIYRTGGTENYRWRRSLPMSKEDAQRVAADVARMGYRVLVESQHRSGAIGLPETFDPPVAGVSPARRRGPVSLEGR